MSLADSTNPFESFETATKASSPEENSSSSQSSDHRATLVSSKSTPNLPSIDDDTPAVGIKKSKKSNNMGGLKNIFKSKKKEKEKEKKAHTGSKELDEVPTQSHEEASASEETTTPPSIEETAPSIATTAKSSAPPAWVSPRQRAVTDSAGKHLTSSGGPVISPRTAWSSASSISPTMKPRIGPSLSTSNSGSSSGDMKTIRTATRSRTGSLSMHRSTVSLDSSPPPRLHVKDTLQKVLEDATQPPPETTLLKKGDGFSPFMDVNDQELHGLKTTNNEKEPKKAESPKTTSRGGMILDSGSGVVVVQVPSMSTPAMPSLPAIPLPFNPDQYDNISVSNNAKTIQNLAMTNALMSVVAEEESTSLLQDVMRSTINKKLQDEAAQGNVMALEIMAKQAKSEPVESIFDKIEAKRMEAEADAEEEDEEFIAEYNDIIKFMASDLPDNDLILAPLRALEKEASLSSSSSSSSEEEEKPTPPPPLATAAVQSPPQSQQQQQQQVPKLTLPTPAYEGEEEQEEEEEGETNASFLSEIKSQLQMKAAAPPPSDTILQQIQMLGSNAEANSSKGSRYHRHRQTEDKTIQKLIEEQTRIMLNTIKTESNQKNQSFIILAKSLYQNNLAIKHIEANQAAQKEILIQQQRWQTQLAETIKQIMIQLQTKNNSSGASSSSSSDTINQEAYAKMEKNYQRITTMLQTMLITMQTMSETVSKYQLELAVVQRVANQQQVEHTRVMNLFEEKFKSTTATYESNKEMLTRQVSKLKHEAKEAKQLILALNQEVANQQNYNLAIRQALEKKNKTVMIQSVEEYDEAHSSTSSSLALRSSTQKKK